MTGWLLDTNVISEWRKPKPERRVVDFLIQQPRASIFTSVVCFAEIRKGIELAGETALRHKLVDWLDGSLRPYFGEKTLDVTEDVVLSAIKLVDEIAKKRKSLSLVDVWIAATARVHHLTIVTRNTNDLIKTGIPVFNPWTIERFNGA
jgi:predicted nucleic acid-binding protein